VVLIAAECEVENAKQAVVIARKTLAESLIKWKSRLAKYS
jgi:hypothetical protein